MARKHVTITREEFLVIKTLIQSFSTAIEAIIESDINHLDKDTELYHVIVDLIDMWESADVRNATEAWVEIDR